MTVPADDGLRAVVAAAMPDHQPWCHDPVYFDYLLDCDDCVCGITDALDRLVAAVREWGERR